VHAVRRRSDLPERGCASLRLVARDPRQAVPISGTWTGFPPDHLGMTVEVEVTAETEANGVPKTAATTRRSAG